MSLETRFDGHGSLYAAWVAAHIPGCENGFSDNYSMAVYRHGSMVAGVVFHNFYPQHGVIEMSAAATDPRWMSRRIVHVAHDFIFNGLGCQLAVMRVSEHNKRMLRIGRALGYDEYPIPRLRGRTEAEVIMTLADNDWRASKWGNTHGQT